MTKTEKAAQLAESWATNFEKDATDYDARAKTARGKANGFPIGEDPGQRFDAAAVELRGRAAVLRNLAHAIRGL